VKVEENNVQKAKVYTALALEHDPSLIHAGFNTKLLLDHEVLLMQAFNCHLLLFSAHTDLAGLLDNLKQSKTVPESAFTSSSSNELSPRAWNVVCDAYCTRICLMEPPSTIALASLLLAAKLLEVHCPCTCTFVQKWLSCLICMANIRCSLCEAVVLVKALH
jgi:hypothetical protein